MSLFTEEDRAELGVFLRSPNGQHLLDYLRANKAPMPPHFTPADGNMQPHHIQLHYAFGIGESAKIDQLIKIAEVKVKPAEPESVTLFDGKTLGR